MKDIIFAALALSVATAASAQETTSYTYDALGRVTAVNHSGSVNAGLQQQYSYDPADNRTNVTVTGATSKPRFLIVPLNGYSVIMVKAP